MNIIDYISRNYNGEQTWFVNEVKRPLNVARFADTLGHKNYLKGRHKILQRQNTAYKQTEYITSKIVINLAKTILNFHTTYLLGKPVTITGSDAMIKQYGDIYYNGNYDDIDFKILDKINKYGDVYEYVYWDSIEKTIKSKLIKAEDGYPIYDNQNNYIAFIEHYKINTIAVENVYEYYNVFYPDRVEEWNNENGALVMTSVYPNVSGLPIHYHSANEDDELFGSSMLDDIVPILDEMESILSKFSDSIYTYSLNPIPVAIGQRIESSIPSDACGFVLNLDDGDFKIPSTMLDYASIKLLYDNLKNHLLDISNTPSVAMGQSNVSNVSETSLKILYQLADARAMVNEKYLRLGLKERFKKIDMLLKKQGFIFGAEDYYDLEFNYSRPVNTNDIMNNLQIQHDMGAISTQTVIEKSPLTNDVKQEMDRLASEDTKTEVKTEE